MPKDLYDFVDRLSAEPEGCRRELRPWLDGHRSELGGLLPAIIETMADRKPGCLPDLVEIVCEEQLSDPEVMLSCPVVIGGLRRLVFSGGQEHFLRAVELLVRSRRTDVFDLVWDLAGGGDPVLPPGVLNVLANELLDRYRVRLNDMLERFASSYARSTTPTNAAAKELLRRLQRELKLVGFEGMIGSRLRRAFWDFLRSDSGNRPLLLLGESRSGKSFLARIANANSGGGEFVEVNCPSAKREKIEKDIQAARGGTLFLEEVHGLARKTAVQTRMLRDLNEYEHEVLVISATDRISEENVATDCPEGIDPALWNRLVGCPFTVPPLRERRDDLQEWIRAEAHRMHIEIADSLVIRLGEGHDYPRNVKDVRDLVDDLAAKARLHLKSYLIDEPALKQIRGRLSALAKHIVDACFPE